MKSNTHTDDKELLEKVVSVTEKGQATIPKEFREALGIDTPGKVKFRETSRGEIIIQPVMSVRSFRGALSSENDQSGVEILRENRQKEKRREEEEFSRLSERNK